MENFADEKSGLGENREIASWATPAVIVEGQSPAL